MTDFGADTWCLDTLQPGRYARGRAAVRQSLYHRLTTPRGTLSGSEEALSYGIDLAEYVGAVGDEVAEILPGIIRGELSKDDRVESVAAAVNEVRNNDGTIELVVSVDVLLVDDPAPLNLTLSVSSVDVSLLSR